MAVFPASDWVPYSSHINDEIIKLKGGSYMMNFRMSGVPYIGVPTEIINARIRQISKFISQLREPYRHNMYLHSHCVKRNITAGLPENFPPSSFVKQLDDDYLQQAILNDPIIGTEYYLTVIYRPYRRRGNMAPMKITLKLIQEFQAQAIEVFNKIKGLVLEYFDDYQVETLSCYEKNGVRYSEQLQFLSTILNLDDTPIPVMRSQISEYLPKAYYSIGTNEIIQIDIMGKVYFATILSFSEYPAGTHGGMLQKFLELPWRMIVSQTFQPIDKSEAKGWLERESKRLESTDNATESEIADLKAAREGVVADNFLLGEYYFQVALIADSKEEIKQKVAAAQGIFSECEFTAVPYKLAKLHAWFSALPGNVVLQPRVAKLSSPNVCHIMPYQTHNHGKRLGNPWGQAVCMFRTLSDEIFYFNFHDTDPNEDSTGQLAIGNTIIAGMTGAGKTVLLSFILAQAQRLNPPPKTIIFDKDLGSSVFVAAMNGKYSRIQLGERTGFNPFQLPDTPQNRAFLSQLVTVILEENGGKLKVSEKNRIEDAINQIMTDPPEMRDIEYFSHYLGSDDEGLMERLYSWTTGEFAWVFNNPTDNFSMDGNNIIGIDYTEFLDIPAIRTPILMYLFHRIELMLDGKPVIISLDEAWKPLSDPAFALFIENKERTIRKQNGVLILTTQSPADFFNTEGMDALIDQVATKILLPNPRAKYDDYVHRLGLEEEEYYLIKNMGVKSREFLIKQQAESTHCYLNLRNVPAVNVLSGSLARAVYAERLQADYGDEWLQKYYDTVHQISKKISQEDDDDNSDDNDIQAA